ncbi:hypothetical protein ACTXT7_013023 [Hymenolepis weldensis]
MRFPALILVGGVTSPSLGSCYPLDMTDLTNATGHSIHWYMYIEPVTSDFADHDGTKRKLTRTHGCAPMSNDLVNSNVGDTHVDHCATDRAIGYQRHVILQRACRVKVK